ncbi:MAG: M42 family peptidase [Chloroflexi bacterium]|nr:M42 family peptidase [Chloroflexota bacterium]
MFALVKELSELAGPTGHEDAVQDWLERRWSGFATDVRRTRVNNILARVGGSGPLLVLVAHADEICLMVKSVTDDGFLHLWPYYRDQLGKPPRWFTPLNQPALVVSSSGNVPGIFATASGHVVGGQNSQKDQFEWNDWFVDIGVRSRDDVESLGIGPGARVIWNPETRRIGRNITGKAMDDRAALAIATAAGELLAGRDDLGYEVWLASTVQEENGLLGAASLADEISFDCAIALDVGLTGDIPGPDKRDFPSRLGAGPIIVYQDASCHYSRRLTDKLLGIAKAEEIPVQRAVFQNYGSDGAALIRRGVETALVTYPTRYTHSPIETVDETDLQYTVNLLAAFVLTGDQGSDVPSMNTGTNS